MNTVIKMPAKGFVKMEGPYSDKGAPVKYRFYVDLRKVSPSLLAWMSTNPREQNLGSQVAKTIAASMREDHRQFHLRNRGILLSAKSANFVPRSDDEGTVQIFFEDHGLHGNIDGGHTLRLILKALEDGVELPEQYVEFEVITGLETAADVAEARNTSVALDIRTMEEMKGSYDVLKEVFGDVEIHGDRFFDRVELKMNQQLEEKNAIDIRSLISILLMFNHDLFSTKDDLSLLESHPIQMYGGKEAALKKYLALGNGEPGARDSILRKMSPVFVDIVKLWDTIERELPLVNERKYKALRFASSRKAPLAMFSNAPLPYHVPQSILFPVVSAFRSLIRENEDGEYFWAADPIEIWQDVKQSMVNTVFMELKAFKGNPTNIVKNKTFWNSLYMDAQIAEMRMTRGLG